MHHPLAEMISAFVIACCGIAVGYIIGKARGRQKASQQLLQHYPLFHAPESRN